MSRDRLHLQRVGEERAAESHPLPEEPPEDPPRQRRRGFRVQRPVDHVGGHQRRDPRADGAAERKQFPGEEHRRGRPHHGQFLVGIGGGVAVPREMLPHRENAPGEAPFVEGDAQPGDGFRVAGERPVPDHGVARIRVHVQDGGKIDVDPDGAELRRRRGAHRRGDLLVAAAEEGARAGRREPGEGRVLQARHAAPLLVDGDQRPRVPLSGGGTDFAAQGAQLGGALDVPRVQDDAARLAPGEQPRKRRGEGLPLEAQPQGGGDGVLADVHGRNSTMVAGEGHLAITGQCRGAGGFPGGAPYFPVEGYPTGTVYKVGQPMEPEGDILDRLGEAGKECPPPGAEWQ